MKKAAFDTPPVYGMSTLVGLGRILPMLGVFLVVALLAVFFGLLASTANPLIVALGAGLLVGMLLLAKPDWNIWFILVVGLLVAGVLPIWADGYASKTVWGISLLGFVLMASALFKAASTPETARGTPAFVWLALTFMLFTLLNSLMQWSSFYELASGFKRHFQVIGLLFAFAWFGFAERQVKRWRGVFVIVALAQLPWTLYELVELVPIREGLRSTHPLLVPIDVVAGTFGAHIYSGGASGEMVTFLIIVLAFLLAHRREKLLRLGKYLLLLTIVLAPLFMGETKVVIILLPIMFLTLYRRELFTRPLYALIMFAMAAALTVGAGYTYMHNMKAQSIDALVTDTLSYNLYEKGYGGYALNRTTVLTFWAEEQGNRDPISAVFGNGLGSAHSFSGSHLAKQYAGYGIDLTAASSLLWEQGLVGTMMFLAMLALAWRTADRLLREAVLPWMRADAAGIQAALSLFAFHFIYDNSVLEGLPFQIVFYSLLGYLAWLHRQHNTIRAAAGT